MASESPATCGICCEPTNRSNRAPRACPFCDHRCCLECLQTYVLSSVHEPHCMAPGCRRAFTLEHQESLLPASFRRGPLKRIQEEVLCVREKALLPETQRYLEAERRTIERRIEALEEEVMLTQANIDRERVRVQMVGIGRKTPRFLELQKRERDVADRISDIMTSRNARWSAEGAAPGEETKKFTWPCPAEGCRGYVSGSWKCGSCNLWSCPDCMEVKGERREAPHTCDPEKKLSAAQIRRDCRPCPACKALIHKISGCDQMYCTACHTPFSWNSGQIVKGVIHNPHYFEFRRLRGGNAPLPREEGDVPCGGLPSTRQMEEFRKSLIARMGERESRTYRPPFDASWNRPSAPVQSPSSSWPGGAPLWSIMRSVLHVSQVVLRRDDGRPWGPLDNQDLRVKYLKQEVEEARFKQLLRHREKRRAKYEAYRDVYRMLFQCGSEALNEMVRGADYGECLRTLDALRAYFNEAMERTSKRFDSSLMPHLDAGFNLNESLIRVTSRAAREAERKRKKAGADEKAAGPAKSPSSAGSVRRRVVRPGNESDRIESDSDSE